MSGLTSKLVGCQSSLLDGVTGLLFSSCPLPCTQEGGLDPPKRMQDAEPFPSPSSRMAAAVSWLLSRNGLTCVQLGASPDRRTGPECAGRRRKAKKKERGERQRITALRAPSPVSLASRGKRSRSPSFPLARSPSISLPPSARAMDGCVSGLISWEGEMGLLWHCSFPFPGRSRG